MEDPNEAVLQSSAIKSSPSVLHTTRSSPSFSPYPEPDINDSVSALNTELESIVGLSQTITTTTTTTTNKVSTNTYHQHIPARLESLPGSSQPEYIKTLHKDNSFIIQASNDVCSLTSSEPKSPATSPISTSKSLILKSPSLHKTASPNITTPPICSVSCPKTSSVSAVLSQPVTITTKTLSLMRSEAPALEPSLNDALDNLLTMNFCKPEAESQNVVATSVRKINSEEQPEVIEGMAVAIGHRVLQPDMHTESEVGDGLIEDLDCRSELLDWADVELKLSYDGADGSMTPMTEASWMDDSLTPSSCPGTPDAQMDLPTLHLVNTMERVSASGHVWKKLQCFSTPIEKGVMDCYC